MRGWIYVFDHPFFTVTDQKGRFEIPDVPPRRYRVVFRQPDIRYKSEREIIVKSGEEAALNATVRQAGAPPAE